MRKEICGILTPVITPFKPTYEIDEDALRHFLHYLVKCKVHGIVPCGSTGEFSLLTSEERKRVAEIVIEEVGEKVTVIIGVTAIRNEDSVMFAQHAKEIGADGLLLAPTYYYSPTEKELYTYYSDVAKIGLPIIVYNIPLTTKVDMTPEFLTRLGEDFSNIRYVKECSGDINRFTEIVRRGKSQMKVLCGLDPMIYSFFNIEPTGAISSASNVLAKECVELYDLMVKGDFTKGKELFFKLLPLFNYIDTSKFVQNVKAGVEILGYSAGPPRKPLLQLEKQEKEELKKLLTEADII